MAEVYDIDAHRKAGLSENVPMTRNRQLLAEIQERFAARTPEQVRTAKINATEEELQAVGRRYAHLLEAKQRLLTPGEIAEREDGADPPEPDRSHDSGQER